MDFSELHDFIERVKVKHPDIIGLRVTYATNRNWGPTTVWLSGYENIDDIKSMMWVNWDDIEVKSLRVEVITRYAENELTYSYRRNND